MALCEKILIAGHTGAGKTSLIWALKPQAPDDWDHFDDLEQLILRAHGKKHEHLATLIEEVGWEKFRLWERQALEGWLKEEGRGVLALGSGSLSPLIWELYGKQRKIKWCYLEVPFDLPGISEERKRIYQQIPWKLDGQKSLAVLALEFWEQLELASK